MANGRRNMKRIASILLFSLFHSLLLAQSNVDRLTAGLDSLSIFSFDGWKVSPDLKAGNDIVGDPMKPGFDDSRWGTLRIGQSIYPDSCWIRKEVVLPEKFIGQPFGGRVRFLVSVDDYGYIWINGESKGQFPWDGEFVLATNAQPGQRFLIAIKAINTGGPLRLLRAEVVSDDAASVQRMIQDFSLSLRVGQKLLGFDTYQTNARLREDPGIDRSTVDKSEKTRLTDLLQILASKVDVEALKAGRQKKFMESLERARSGLKPIGDYARSFTLFFDANAHIDAAWLWREKETIEVCKNTFSSVLTMMQQRPDFTYTQSSAAYYSWMERLYPDLYSKIQQRVRDGRWEVIGGMWVEPDCNLPGGESWVRHLLYAKRYFKQKLGIDVKIGWNPDSFGYNGNMPLFYRQAGIDAFITQKIGWNETNVFPYRLFWWESPDGSRILSYFPFDYVNTVDDPFRLVDWLRQFDANTGVRKMMVLFGVGDHGGGPSLQMLERIDHLKSLDVYPSIEYGTASQYIGWLKRQDLAKLPTWKDELYLEYHQGTFTTQAKMKAYNRKCEVLLTNVEKFSAFASLYGGPYKRTDIEDAWRKVLFNQFHDILPGSGIREVYIDAAEEHREAQSIGEFELKNSLKYLAQSVNTSKIRKGIPLVVFNPLSWDRSDLVKVDLPEGDLHDYAVFDTSGKEVPSQILSVDRHSRMSIFIAEGIPSLGYACYELRRTKPAVSDTELRVSSHDLENSSFRISIDRSSGWVTSITDKRNGKEILSGPGNELQLLQDVPSAWDAWNIGLTGVTYPSQFRHAEVVESGPVRVILRLYRDYLKPGVKKDFPTEDFPTTFFTQDIVLYRGIDRIDFVTGVDWWEEKTMLKVAFPLTVSDTTATYEIPYGTIQRSTRMQNSWERAKTEVPAQRWADVSAGDYGVSLLNNSKYGYDIKGNVIRLSLLRSPKWPDPTADRGKHMIEYALFPHAGGWRKAKTVQRGNEYNNPLLAVLTDSHPGKLPPSNSFARLTPSNLVLTTIKKAEDGDSWVIQWYDCAGQDSRAVLELPLKPKKAFLSNFLEEDGSPVVPNGKSIVVDTKRHTVQTIKVSF